MKLRKSTLYCSSKFLAAAFSATFFCHFAASSAFAANRFWSANGTTASGNGTWNTSTVNRWGTVAAGPYTLAWVNGVDVAVLGTVAASSLTLGENITCGGITAQANNSGSGNINESASLYTLTLGITGNNVFSGFQSTTAGRPLSINAVIVGAAGANVVLTGPSSTPTQVAAMSLNRANTYVGSTSFSGSSSGAVNLTLGNQLALQNSTLILSAACKNLIFNDTVTANAFTFGGLAATTAGAGRDLALQNDATTPAAVTLSVGNNDANTSYAAVFSGAGSLVKIGSGSLTLSGINTFTGNTTISEGKLVGVVTGDCASSKVIIDNTLATLGISVTDNTETWTCKELAPTAVGEIEFSFGAVIPSTTVSPLTITVPTLLTGLADFTAATPKIRVTTDAALAPGTYPLMTWDTATGTIPSTADLIPPTLLSQTEATLEVSGNTLYLVITSTAATVVKANNPDNLNLGTSWVGGTAPDTNKLAVWNSVVTTPNTTVLATDATWAGITILNPNGLVTINGSSTLTLGNTAIDIDLSTANTADLTLNCPLALGADNIWDIAATRTATLTGQISGAFPVTKQGDGTAILSSAANNYSGNTTVAAGTLQLGASNVIPDGIGNGNVSIAGILDLNGESETVNGLSGAGIIDNTLAATSPVLTVGANDQTSTFSGAIQSTAGTVNLNKTGNGTLTLNGANTFTGNVAIAANSGTLVVGNVTPLDNVTGITMGDGTTLRSSVNGAVINAPITLGGVGTTATIHASIFDGSGSTLIPFTLGGAITGDGDLILNGVETTNSYGLIILNAASSYTGSTRMDTESAFAGGPPNNTNIFVRLGVENALPVTTKLTLDGGDGTGTSGRFCELNLNGNNQTLAGLTNVTGNVDRSQEIYNTSGTLATLTVNNTDPFTYSGKLGGQIGPSGSTGDNLALTKSGAGTFTIAGANTYTGATTINGGTLALGALGTLPNASAVSIGAGTLNAATTGTETAGTLDVTGNATISLAAGAQLVFADSSGGGTATWAGNLSIGGFVSGSSLNFGSSSGLTAQQLSKISATGFTNFGLDAEGDLTADPVSGGTFADWLIANAPATGFVTDTDNDGLSNGVENVLGSNPNAYNAGLTEVSSTATSVIFKHTLNPTVASDVTYGYEWSTDLTEWKTTGQTNTGLTTATITPSAPVLGVVTVTVTITGGPSAKLFGRLVGRN
jgi:autotransporter-associated beta strand protein